VVAAAELTITNQHGSAIHSSGNWIHKERLRVYRESRDYCIENGLVSPTMDQIRQCETLAGHTDYGAKWAIALAKTVQAPLRINPLLACFLAISVYFGYCVCNIVAGFDIVCIIKNMTTTQPTNGAEAMTTTAAQIETRLVTSEPEALNPIQKTFWRLLSGRPVTKREVRAAVPASIPATSISRAIDNLKGFWNLVDGHYVMRETMFGFRATLAEMDARIESAARRGDKETWVNVRDARIALVQRSKGYRVYD
jgi:hypothetical protein